MKDFWVEFKTAKFAVHTHTKKDYDSFIEECSRQKMIWYNAIKAKDYNIFPYTGKDTYISFGGRGVYGHLDFSCSADTYKAKGMKIILWDSVCAAELNITALLEEKKALFEEKLANLAEELEEDAVRMYALAYSMLRRNYTSKFTPLDCYDIRKRMDTSQTRRLARICRVFTCDIDEISMKSDTDSSLLFTKYVDEDFSE